MAYQIHQNEQGDFQAAVGQPVKVGVTPATTALSSASYNGKLVTVTDGAVIFTPVAGSEYLNLVVDPPHPPEDWSVVEISGDASQKVEDVSQTDQVITLIIVGV
jgi:hypothetical protein